MNDRLHLELKSNETIWGEGYYEGDPRDPMASSSYGRAGYMSVLHATYLRCIKPYVRGATALEIGPGRGAWTKSMLDAEEVWTIDARPAKDDGFFEYIGEQAHVTRIQVHDFACTELPTDHFNYMFSFGCLCHVSFDGISEYAKNLFSKLQPGTVCFWMVADYGKYKEFLDDYRTYHVSRALIPRGGSWRRFLSRPVGATLSALQRSDSQAAARLANWTLLPPQDVIPMPGRWFHAGIDRTCTMLEGFGYEIVDKDVGTVPRDPIIQFVRP